MSNLTYKYGDAVRVLDPFSFYGENIWGNVVDYKITDNPHPNADRPFVMYNVKLAWFTHNVWLGEDCLVKYE